MGRAPRAERSREGSRHRQGTTRPDGIFKTLRTGLKRFWSRTRNPKPTSLKKSSIEEKTQVSFSASFGFGEPPARRSPRTLFNPRSLSQNRLNKEILGPSTSSSPPFWFPICEPPAPQSPRIAAVSRPTSTARPVTVIPEHKLIINICRRKLLRRAGPADFMKAVRRELYHNATPDRAAALEIKKWGGVPVFKKVRYRIVYIQG